MPSPTSRPEAAEAMEGASERCLVIQSRPHAHVDPRHAGLPHQLFGMVNAMLHQQLVSGCAERGFERAGKVADGEPTFACDVSGPDAAMHVLMKKFRCSSLLPWRQTSL